MYGSSTDEKQIVRLPETLLGAGVLCSVFFGGLSYYAWKDKDMITCIGLMLFCMLSCTLIAAYFNCRITYDRESFTHKNFFGISRTYTYEQITGIYGDIKDVKMHVGEKKIRIDQMATGKSEFVAYAQFRYECIYGCPIPQAENKLDIFNGNLESPGEFIFVYSIVLLFFIGAFVYIFIETLPMKPEDLTYETLDFTSYEFDDESIVLYADGYEEYFRITPYEEIMTDADDFISKCADEEQFEIGYIYYGKADTPFYSIETISDSNGKFYVTLESSNNHLNEIHRILSIVFGFVIALWVGFCALSAYVARNAHKFSPEFVHIFFQKGYVKNVGTGRNSKKKSRR